MENIDENALPSMRLYRFFCLRPTSVMFLAVHLIIGIMLLKRNK